MENFFSIIQGKNLVSDDLKEELKNSFTKSFYPKGTVFIKEGNYCSELFFLKSGLVRAYCYDQEKEITTWFHFADDIFTSFYSFFSKRRSFENFETLEDSTVFSIQQKDLDRLYDSYPQLERFMRLHLEESVAEYDYFTKGFLFMTAKKRYEQLLSLYPDIEQRVNLGHIASYLGITQETLSRIRSK